VRSLARSDELTRDGPTACRRSDQLIAGGSVDTAHLRLARVTEKTVSRYGGADELSGQESSRSNVRRTHRRLSRHNQHSELPPADAWARYWHARAEDPPYLRVPIADKEQRSVTEIATVISGPGHSVVAQLLDVSQITEATGREHPTWRSSGSMASRATRLS